MIFELCTSQDVFVNLKVAFITKFVQNDGRKEILKNIKLHTVPVNVNFSVHAVLPNYHVKILHP